MTHSLLQPHGLYVVFQAPLSRGFPRQEYWSGLRGAARVHPTVRASPPAPPLRPGLFAARLNHSAVRLPTCPCSPLKREIPAGPATTLRAPPLGPD